MNSRPCARWCAAPAVRYDICCHAHWRTLDDLAREYARASFHARYGFFAYAAQRAAEIAAERTLPRRVTIDA